MVGISGIELLLESLDRRIDPGSGAREHRPHDSSNVVIPKIVADGTWEVLYANRTLGTILLDVGAR